MKKILSIAANHQLLLAASIFCLGLGLFIGRQSVSGGRFFDDEPVGHDHQIAEEDDHDEHGHEGHDHAAAEAVEPDELAEMACEHNVPIADCDDCRYEVGLVKIVPAVAENLIETGQVREIDSGKTLEFTGQIQLDRTRTVDVISAGGGQVKQVLALFGDRVEQGDVLAVIHSPDFGQAKANFLEIQAKLELTRATFQREKSLYEQKVTSQAEYLDALNAMKSAEAAYAAAEKRLNLFGLNAEQIGRINQEQENGEFADLLLYAPQAGTVIAQNLSAGVLVDSTEILYTIADLSNVWAWCDVYEKDLAALHEQFARKSSLPAVVHVNAFDGGRFEGTADLIGNVMDEQTRTVKMRVQVKNPDYKLKPGLFATIRVNLPGQDRVTVVPRSAVMSDAGRQFVFTHFQDDLWARRDIRIGARYGGDIEVLDGIAAGEPVVTGGAFMLKSDVLREKMGAGCAD